MYAIIEDSCRINGEEVQTFGRTVDYGNTLIEVEAGTTGFRGGCDRGKGARAYLSLDVYQGDFLFSPITDDNGRVTGIEIACCGDDALMSLAESLDFAMKAFIDQCTDEADR
ncbi:MAG: hypothetical protein IJ708_07395 [Clostridia bacterium]|nr:hypothetical protein [Clostridia bacterium]